MSRRFLPCYDSNHTLVTPLFPTNETKKNIRFPFTHLYKICLICQGSMEGSVIQATSVAYFEDGSKMKNEFKIRNSLQRVRSTQGVKKELPPLAD